MEFNSFITNQQVLKGTYTGKRRHVDFGHVVGGTE